MNYLATMTGAQKKEPGQSTRLEPVEKSTITELMKKHGAKNRSDYIRGLIYLDAHLSGYGTKGLTKPGWVSTSYDLLFELPPVIRLQSIQEVLDAKKTRR